MLHSMIYDEKLKYYFCHHSNNMVLIMHFNSFKCNMKAMFLNDSFHHISFEYLCCRKSNTSFLIIIFYLLMICITLLFYKFGTEYLASKQIKVERQRTLLGCIILFIWLLITVNNGLRKQFSLFMK